MAKKTIKQVKADLSEIILVCRKCSKKLKGGFGPKSDRSLSKALRRELKTIDDLGKKHKTKGRRTRVSVIEVGCFNVCPKGSVVAVRAANPRQWLVIPEGTPIDTVTSRLGLTSPGEAEIS